MKTLYTKINETEDLKKKIRNIENSQLVSNKILE